MSPVVRAERGRLSVQLHAVYAGQFGDERDGGHAADRDARMAHRASRIGHTRRTALGSPPCRPAPSPSAGPGVPGDPDASLSRAARATSKPAARGISPDVRHEDDDPGVSPGISVPRVEATRGVGAPSSRHRSRCCRDHSRRKSGLADDIAHRRKGGTSLPRHALPPSSAGLRPRDRTILGADLFTEAFGERGARIWTSKSGAGPSRRSRQRSPHYPIRRTSARLAELQRPTTIYKWRNSADTPGTT
jgi:hypothetical protein